MKTRFLLTLVSLLAATVPTFADGLIVVHHPPMPPLPHPMPPPWIRPHPVFAPLEVVYHNVDVTIDGQVATTRVDQEFFNPNDAVLEGDYLFPIPEGAHIDKFSMRVGGQDLEAELLDADKARRIYEDIVRQMRDPALLEYTGRGAFRVRIYPIEPRSHKRVQLTYTQLLRNNGGVVSYLYPLNTEKFSAQPLQKASIRIDLKQPASIKALYSPTHEIEVRRDGDRHATIGWETSKARPDRDFQLLFSTDGNDVGVSLVAHQPGTAGEDGAFLLLVSPGADVLRAGEKPNPKDVVLVLDTSGSMAGRKLEQAKKALTFCVENLNNADRFEVIKFATEAESCFEKLVEASRANRESAGRWIEDLRPIGGTAIHDALQRALALRPSSKERPFVVIFLTDGQPTIGETSEERIVASVAPGSGVAAGDGATTRIFCFGIGTDVNTHLLDRIVERTRAASQYVLPDEDLELKVSSFFTKIKDPLLTNLKITWPTGVRVSKELPRPLPDLFRGDQLVLTGRYSGSGAGDVIIEGLINGRPRRITQRVSFAEREPANTFVLQLWAMRRVGWLLDEIRLRGESQELRDEVVDLARRYAIVTPYTSYLIVEDERTRNVPVARRTMRGLDEDAVAYEAFSSNYVGANREKSGDRAAYNLRGNARFKQAMNFSAALDAAQNETAASVVAGSPAVPDVSARTQAQVSSMQTGNRVVNGKAFYQNGSQWVDADLQQKRADAPAKTVRLQFASAEYFQFLTDNRWAGPWLALGSNVQFTAGDTVYEIYE